MTDADEPRSSLPDDPAAAEAPAPPDYARAAWELARITLALPFYGAAWLCAAAAALVWYGVLGGWRDVRDFTRPDPSE